MGKNRIETAIKISQEGWKSAETVILVNDSAIPDALTATPLAFAKNAPILLTGKDGLNKATAEEIKRLDAKDVIMIGGDAVLSSNVEKDLKALNVKVDRIKGATREETALAIAKRLDGIKDVSEIAVVNGTNGLADAVSVAAAAAERNMPILLANPKKGLAISEKFIKDENINISYIIGGKTVLPDKLVSKLPGKQRIEGLDRKDTNAKVIEKFYTGKELDNVYLAKDGMGDSGQLIDALAVGALAAKNGAPVLIASKKLSEKQIDVINTKRIDTITQVGGNGNEKAFSELKEIEKEVVIKVKSELELQEALDKANANDIIEGIYVTDEETLSKAIENAKKGETIVLANDITLSKVMKLSPSGEITINLNNYTLDSKKIKFDKDTKAPIESIGVNQTLTIKNGKLNLNSISPTNSCISVGKDGTFNLEDVVYTSETTGVYAIGENATINIIDSTISAYVYCIGTNAGELANYNSIFNIEGSTINMTSNVGGDAILINVPCKFYMNNSTVNSDYQGIIVRGGTATISNTTITNIIDDKYKDQNNYINENWKTGNEVPCGGLIIGNRGGGYQYPSNVELKNVTIKDGNKNDPYPAVYMWGNDGDGLGATLTHEGCTIDGDIILGNDKCTINGEKGPLPKPVEPEKPTQPETTTNK
ncbi:cell wall-binding repeat-containing protein [Peptacetobacter sp.]|uniref:cell wall-binding repeat-containing protein n=1 Tax=Peptacetobacter sp. TaxID=2991975 RepID=UPI002E77E61D|nr:cell wall-binding repeat-containing protein [Peptacetobacter sp.]MEE0451690.1 cell wall-binding repeat-containing protein [Peptacetobacter sp.]